MARKLSAKERSARLGAEVARLQRDGWLVQNRTSTTAQLILPAKKPGCLTWVLLGPFALLVKGRDRHMFVDVTETGRVLRNEVRR